MLFPLWAVLIIAAAWCLAMYVAIRRMFRINRGISELDDAEREGRLSPVIREVWRRERREFVVVVVGILIFFLALIWAVNSDIQIY